MMMICLIDYILLHPDVQSYLPFKAILMQSFPADAQHKMKEKNLGEKNKDIR